MHKIHRIVCALLMAMVLAIYSIKYCTSQMISAKVVEVNFQVKPEMLVPQKGLVKLFFLSFFFSYSSKMFMEVF